MSKKSHKTDNLKFGPKLGHLNFDPLPHDQNVLIFNCLILRFSNWPPPSFKSKSLYILFFKASLSLKERVWTYGDKHNSFFFSSRQTACINTIRLLQKEKVWDLELHILMFIHTMQDNMFPKAKYPALLLVLTDPVTHSAWSQERGSGTPPHLLWVFSIATKVVTGRWGSSSRIFDSSSWIEKVPSGRLLRDLGWTPPSWATPPCS